MIGAADSANRAKMQSKISDPILSPSREDLDFLEASNTLCEAHVINQNRNNLKRLRECAQEAVVGGKDTISGERGFFGTIFSLFGQAPARSVGEDVTYTSSNGSRAVTNLKKLLDKPNPSKKNSTDLTKDAETEFEAMTIEQQTQVLRELDDPKHRKTGKAMGILGRMRMVIGLGSGGVSIMTSLLVAIGVISSAAMPFFIPIIFGAIGATLFVVPMIVNAIRRFGSDKQMTQCAKRLYRRLDHSKTIDPKLKSGQDMAMNVSEKKHKLQLVNSTLYDKIALASNHSQIYDILVDCTRRCGKQVDEHMLMERARYLYEAFNPNSLEGGVRAPLSSNNLQHVGQSMMNNPKQRTNELPGRSHESQVKPGSRSECSVPGLHEAAEIRRRSASNQNIDRRAIESR